LRLEKEDREGSIGNELRKSKGFGGFKEFFNGIFERNYGFVLDFIRCWVKVLQKLCSI
jgi:hypothetical protein